MQQKKSIDFGFRGWMLVIYQAIAFFTFTVFTNYPMNILPDLYGGAQKISTIYTIATIVCIVIQLVLSRVIGKVKNVKMLSVWFGVITLVLSFGVMTISPMQRTLWQICYALVVIFSVLYCTFSLGILVGQWFPRRKGTVMGVATVAFPITNGVIGVFAGSVFGKLVPALAGTIGEALGKAAAMGDAAAQGLLGPIMGMIEEGNINGALSAFVNSEAFAASEGFRAAAASAVFNSFLPFFIISVVGLLIGVVFLKDYPEQVGAFRDNDKSFAPEEARAIMEQEIVNKKTSVWQIGNTFKSRDFWFVTIPMGALLLCAVGMMTQTNAIIGNYAELPYATVMAVSCVVACFGSWLLGVLDTKFGTKKAIIISVVIMIVGGVIGAIRGAGFLLASFFCLSIFEGAASNFTVSAAAQYWRREDFANVFACVNPIANVLQAAGPMIIAGVLFTRGYQVMFGVSAVIGVVSLVLILLFSPRHVKETDDKYRLAAGKPLDDALVGRK